MNIHQPIIVQELLFWLTKKKNSGMYWCGVAKLGGPLNLTSMNDQWQMDMVDLAIANKAFILLLAVGFSVSFSFSWIGSKAITPLLTV